MHQKTEQQSQPQQQPLTKKQRREMRKMQKQQARATEEKRKNTNRLMLWGAVIIGLIVVVIVITRLPEENDNNDAPIIVGPSTIASTDHVKGNPNAPVVLIEYSDFQCPACGSYFPIVKQVLEDHGESVAFAYRHFPLRQIHRNAQLAGQAAEAADQQGKFFEMHDLLFENQPAWNNLSRGKAKDAFVEYAESLELDIVKFKEDIDSKEAQEKVDNDYSSGLAAGVNATPTFFLNGEKISVRSYADFVELINQNTPAPTETTPPITPEGVSAQTPDGSPVEVKIIQ